MIEDKKDGIKIAENEEEAFWIRTKESIEKDIQSARRSIEMNEHLLRFVAENVGQKK